MKHDWIFDVLADLRTYAEKNHLPQLAEQLEETTLLAAVEIASTEGDLGADEARRFRNSCRPFASPPVTAPVVS